MNRAILGLSVKALVAAAIVLALLLAFAAMWMLGWGFFKRETADYRGETDMIEQISADADYRISQYEWFFDQCAAIQTKEAELAAAHTELETTTPSDYRRQQLNANISAITAARAELINAYNAEASKTDTAANFQASDLPHKIDIESETTTCTAE